MANYCGYFQRMGWRNRDVKIRRKGIVSMWSSLLPPLLSSPYLGLLVTSLLIKREVCGLVIHSSTFPAIHNNEISALIESKSPQLNISDVDLLLPHTNSHRLYRSSINTR